MKVPIFTLSSVLMKICQIPHVIFQTTSHFLFTFCMTLQCQTNIALRYVFRSNVYTLHKSSQKSENFHLDWIFLSKAYKDLNEKVQKSSVLWHWRVMQSFKKNWLLVPKMTWGILWILMRAVAVWKFALWCATFVNSVSSFG